MAKFLIDLGVGKRVEDLLSKRGHDVKTVRNLNIRAKDADIPSRSASELLLAQKTELPCLATVCSGDPDARSIEKCGTGGTDCTLIPSPPSRTLERNVLLQDLTPDPPSIKANSTSKCTT